MFSFASSYQLDIFSGLEIGSCVNLLSNCLDSIKLGPVQALGMFPLSHLFLGISTLRPIRLHVFPLSFFRRQACKLKMWFHMCINLTVSENNCFFSVSILNDSKF